MQGSGQPGSTGDPSQGSQVPGSGPAAPPPASWQSTPQPPSGGTATSGASWTPASAGSAPVAGAPGLFYADVPNRVIAYIIDVILIAIVNFIIGAVIGGAMGGLINTNPQSPGFGTVNTGAIFITGILGLIVSAAYFIFMWSNRRATVGMQLLGMQIGDEKNGSTITTSQAGIRWLVLSAPGVAAQVFNSLPVVGLLISLAGLIWVIVLLYTTAQSPTKQGLHDKYAKTMIVKAARSAG
jgi:uncharacterized RDD family membrane protein YckC